MFVPALAQSRDTLHASNEHAAVHGGAARIPRSAKRVHPVMSTYI